MNEDDLIDYLQNSVTPKPPLHEIEAFVHDLHQRAELWAEVSGWGSQSDGYIRRYLDSRARGISEHWNQHGRPPTLGKWDLEDQRNTPGAVRRGYESGPR